MKILIVQLLRLGDIVLSTPVMKGLREQFPDAQIDLLIHQQFIDIVPMLPGIDRVFTFDREAIQTSIGEPDRFVFESFNRVQSLIQDLSQQNYDKIFNLTHNKLSAFLIGALESKEKVGFWIDHIGQPIIDSAWFRHLNSDDLGDDAECFHLVDIYKAASNIKKSRIGLSLNEDPEAQEKIKNKFGARPLIVVQALTSDQKKNWGLQRYRSVIETMAQALPQYHVVVVGAPHEEQALVSAFGNMISCEIYICDLKTVFSLVKRAELVISGDTSIKHFSAAAKTRTIEISIGSSDIKKTGTYSERALVLQSKEECAPCFHSKPCHQSEHFCARRLSSDLVSLVAIDYLRNNSLHLKKIAEEFSDEVEIFKIDIVTTGYWSALPVRMAFSEAQVSQLYHKFAAKMFIEHQSREKNIFEVFGSESERLAILLKNTFKNATGKDWKLLLADFERKSQSLDARVKSLESHFYQFRLADTDSAKSKELLQTLLSLRERARMSPALRIQKDHLDRIIDDQTPVFVRLRKVQQVIGEMKLKSEIELKLIRSLQSFLEV